MDISLADVKQGRRIASGKFGEVFLGELDGERVVLKKPRKNVRGAGDFFDAEGLINRKLKGCKAVPAFLGVAGADVYLVWKYEGTDTLETFMENPKSLGELGRKLGIANGSREQICGRTMRGLLQAVSALHQKGVVHRDIKPANILVAESSSSRGGGIFSLGGGSGHTLKLIDLGGAADLRTGVNYSDSETVFDPIFAPPEKYIEGSFGGLFGAVSWLSAKPDLFDAYGAGICMLMLCVPQVRPSRRDLPRRSPPGRRLAVLTIESCCSSRSRPR